jgi:DNA-binding MarR family transcriptional regulator
MSGLAQTAAAEVGPGEVVEALLLTSRVMVALAARSLAGLDTDVTLAQHRALVVLASRGPQRAVDIAVELGVNPSTGTRMCDRLVRKGLIRRARIAGDRRVVRLTLTAVGRGMVDEVTRRRREELAKMVAAIAPEGHAGLVAALRSFTVAADEPPDGEWWLGWRDELDGDPAA